MILIELLQYLLINSIFSDVPVNSINNSTLESKHKYSGEKFPKKYLVPEVTLPDVSDLVKYIQNLNRTVSYFNQSPNSTDCNIALGTFYTKALLKRILKDYKRKVKQQYDDIVDIISKCENILSHYVYKNRPRGWEDYEYRLTRLLIDDNAQIHSVSTLNKGRFVQWLLSNANIHEYVQELDDISLPRVKYVEFIGGINEFYVNPEDSDYCIIDILYEPEPIHFSKLQSCRPDPYCLERLHSSPSITYALSHRLLNIMMRHQMRRCYLKSVKQDESHMDLLCAFMYRETVYLARRGFFARDLFLEQIALCAMLGYEEFHRRHWFNKAVSWIDDQGCVQENPNYNYNMTSFLSKTARAWKRQNNSAEN